MTVVTEMRNVCIAGVDMPELLPCGYLVGDNTNIAISLKGWNISYDSDNDDDDHECVSV